MHFWKNIPGGIKQGLERMCVPGGMQSCKWLVNKLDFLNIFLRPLTTTSTTTVDGIIHPLQYCIGDPVEG